MNQYIVIISSILTTEFLCLPGILKAD